ncbi:ankyrin repeat-containing domain protein [Jimgerdemannia flammicorona]|uniref:Ankyrin repeat-containing domain protein n=1 Tax=Jimgerdemannia flammicorona TaxID=994334 RepID=A0A433DG92_9FUNG|nr:ankyrin repeat-containing domain protein [Jimgerdemannia flammicorona]
MIKWLFESKSDTAILDKFGKTAFQIAIELGNINSAQSLARYHQNEIDVFYHHAIQCKQIRIAKLLSDIYDANVNSIDNKYQQTPLHTALSTQFKPEIDIIEDLITEHQIDVNVTDGAGNTPLHICAMYNHIDMVRLLAGANPHIYNNEGLMPLHIATGRSLTEIAIQLVRMYGAKVNAATAETGITAFEVAIICRSMVPFLTMLIELGAAIEPNLLHVAVNHDDYNLLEFLNNYIHISHTTGCLLLNMAIYLKHLKIAEYLISNFGVSKNLLHLAAKSNNVEFLLLALKYSDDINPLDSLDQTPYDVANALQHKQMCRILWGRGGRGVVTREPGHRLRTIVSMYHE